MYINEKYFEVLEESGVLYLFSNGEFLEEFIRQCRGRLIPVRTYKRKGFFEIRRDK